MSWSLKCLWPIPGHDKQKMDAAISRSNSDKEKQNVIPKKNGFLIVFLLLAGLILLSVPALAGYWAVEFTSTGGGHVHTTSPGSGETDEDRPFVVSQFWPVGKYDCHPEDYGADSIISNWCGDVSSGYCGPDHAVCQVAFTGSGTITVGFRWITNDNEPAPQVLWAKLATGIASGGIGYNLEGSISIDNYFEDVYSQSNHIDYPGETCWVGMPNAQSYGFTYVQLDGSSGFASVPLSLGISTSYIGADVSACFSMYAYARPLDSAPPLSERKSGVPWRTGSPHYYVTPGFSARNGGTQSGGDPVDLATGAHLYLPAADIACYNPYGPDAIYQRNYLGLRAESDYSSPGLSPGWVDNYDVKIVASFTTEGDLDKVNLIYPNGSQDMLYEGIVIGISSMSAVAKQEAKGGNGTVTTLDWEYPIELSVPTGAPYFITSVPSQTPNRWESITLTFKDQTQWVFTTNDGLTYYLSRIANRMGRYISIIRDANNGYRLSSVTNDSTPANDLLSFHYNGSNLSYVSDAYGRKVTYTFGSAAGTTCLLSVSQLTALGAGNPSPLEQYGYTSIQDHPHITTISSPSPTGSGLCTETVNYDTSTLKVISLVDANGNQNVFTYDGYNGKTQVQIKDSQGTIVKEWTERFDPSNGSVHTGTADAKGRVTSLLFEDTQNSGMPTTITDREGKATTITYDPFGNIKTITDSRGTTTTYVYNYPDNEYLDDEYPDSEYPTDFRMGRLMKIQQGSKTPTTFTYYEPSGLLHTITAPKPGTTSETVTTTFTYDSLGNMLTKVVPGNPNNQTTTYNYTQDGTYTQPARLGQPLTVTDSLSHVTHYRYDDRGNTIWTIDALGNRTDFTYNIADQLMTTINPSTLAP